MNSNREDIKARFHSLADEEIIHLMASGNLTELAQSVAVIELQQRGLSIPASNSPENNGMESTAQDIRMRMVARYLTPTEAYIMCARLQAEGIPAETGDTHFVQAQPLFSTAVGGACIRVPLEFVTQALEVVDAFNRGDFQLDDTEVNDPTHS